MSATPHQLTRRHPTPRFALGRLVFTPAITTRIATSPAFAAGIMDAITRHNRRDWGVIRAVEAFDNTMNTRYGGRVHSAHVVDGERIWIITAPDRQTTTVQFSSERIGA